MVLTWLGTFVFSTLISAVLIADLGRCFFVRLYVLSMPSMPRKAGQIQQETQKVLRDLWRRRRWNQRRWRKAPNLWPRGMCLFICLFMSCDKPKMTCIPSLRIMFTLLLTHWPHLTFSPWTAPGCRRCHLSKGWRTEGGLMLGRWLWGRSEGGGSQYGKEGPMLGRFQNSTLPYISACWEHVIERYHVICPIFSQK